MGCYLGITFILFLYKLSAYHPWMIVAWIKHYYNSCWILIFLVLSWLLHLFVGFLLKSSAFFIYFFLYISKIHGFHFTLLVMIHSSIFILMHKLSHIWLVGAPSCWFLCDFWQVPLSFWDFLAFWNKKIFQSQRVLCQLPSVLQRALIPVSGEWDLDTKTWALGVLIMSSPSQWTVLRNVLCLYMCVIHICIYFYIYVKLKAFSLGQ